jgi:superoxide dismutase, Cu-Zn family
MPKTTLKLFFVFVLLISLTGTALAQEPTTAMAELKDVQGKVVGNAALTQEAGGVKVMVTLSGLTGNAGEHGIHIHTTGQCTPDFSAAGGHFNPTNAQHGLNNPAGPHGGDGPNLQLAADGSASYEVVNDRVTLGSGPNSLFDADGSAVVVHAGPDDQVTDPSGNSGDRIACGVIVAGAAAAAAPTQLPQSGGVNYLPAILIALGAVLFSGGMLLRRAGLWR